MISEVWQHPQESTKFEMIITQKLFELQPFGLTCVVMLTCELIGKILIKGRQKSWFSAYAPIRITKTTICNDN